MRPYVSTILNTFDGIILQLVVIISALPVMEFFDNYDENFALIIIYILVTWPLISFIGIKLWINKKNIKKVYEHLLVKCSHKYKLILNDDGEEPIEANEIGIIVDDNMRRNALVVDV